MELLQTLHGLDLTTPSLLFSATSLILLAYTNRFLSYASVVRNLKDKYDNNPESDPTSLAQIRNFRIRLRLIRLMQIFGASSLLFSLIAMFCIYIGWMLVGDITFGIAMVLLASSLIVCIMEIQISVEALELNLQTIKDRLKDRDPHQNNSFRRFGTNRREGSDDEQRKPKDQPKQQQRRKEDKNNRGKEQNREQKEQRKEPREQNNVPRKDREPREQKPEPPREERQPRPDVKTEKPSNMAEQSRGEQTDMPHREPRPPRRRPDRTERTQPESSNNSNDTPVSESATES